MSILIQCSSLFLLGVIMYFYLTQKRLQLNIELAYLRIWIATIISVLLDIVYTLIVNVVGTRESFFPIYLSKLYLLSLFWVAITADLYIIEDIHEATEFISVKRRHWTMVGIVLSAIVLLLPANISGDYGSIYHVRGVAVEFAYFMSFVLLAAIAFTTENNRNSISQKRREAIWIWILTWVCGASIQMFFPDYKMTSFAGALGVMIIYLKLENPESNIDRNSGLFNQHALMQYVRQLLRNKQSFSVIGMIYDQNIRPNTLPADRKVMKMELMNKIGNVEGSVAFRVSQDEILLVFYDEERLEPALKEFIEYFNNHDNMEKLQIDTTAWVILKDCKQIGRAEDLLKLFGYIRRGGKRFDEQSVYRSDANVINEMYRERDMEALIEEAIKGDRFEVFYQPIYSNETKSVHSAEALVRIRREDGSLVPPGAFIELAESNGTIVHIGERVFEKVCNFIHDENIKEMGLDFIEINLSVVQACKPGLAERYIEIMEENDIDPSMINLEITESAPNEQKFILLNNMEKLLTYGIRFSLDDFGTGQSNLNYIVDMPVEIIKFDRNLINAYFEGGKARFVMDAAMQMIKSMDLSIVAEGIETKDQLEEMRRLGIRFIQGYYFSKPLSRNDFVKYVQNFAET